MFSTAAFVALVLTRLCLVTSTLAGHAICFAGGCIYKGSFAGGASVTKGGATVAVGAVGAVKTILA